MSIIRTVICGFALSVSLSGCTQFEFPGVYKLEIQQGNIVTQEMIDTLKPGQSKHQVRYILGSPLVADTFNPQRWDYYWSQRNSDGDTEKKSLSIFFVDDKLDYFSGDYLPSAVAKGSQPAEGSSPSETVQAAVE